MSFEQPLRHSITSTLAYFDLADFPLTKEELYAFLWQPPMISYNDFLLSLRGADLPATLSFARRAGGDEAIPHPSPCPSPNRGGIEGGVLSAVASKFGYYFLSGREKIAEERRRRLLFSEQKLKIARQAVKLIRSIPFLRAVFVCNTVGSEQANNDSDIDFFIITEKNRIWITRLLITFWLELFRLRRTNKRIKNKVCLSFYVTVDNLDLASVRAAEDDVHFCYWLKQMLPVFDPDNYYSKFLQANQWTKKYLPNADQNQASPYVFKIEGSRFGKIWKKFWEKMWEGSYGDLINSQAKKIQLAKMKFSGKEVIDGRPACRQAGDKGVVISDGILKFHEKDSRIKYREEWKKKISAASLPY